MKTRPLFTRARWAALVVAVLATLSLLPGLSESANAATSSSSTVSKVLVYDNEMSSTYPSSDFAGCTHNGCPLAPLSYMGAEPAGTKDDSGHCTYNAAEVVSEANGILNLHAHTDSNGQCWAVNLHPESSTFDSQTYGQYEMLFRSDNIPYMHFGVIWWPDNNQTGEIDGPEANIGSPWHGFVHQSAVTLQPFDIYVQQTISTPGWHYWIVNWLPASMGGITMSIDGHNLPIQGVPPSVPNKPMHLAIHLESWMGTSQRPTTASTGNVQIDWLRVWKYVGI